MAKDIIDLSVAIITFNEEKKLEKTLQSVYDFVNEIIVVDSGSTDKTIEIAKKYGCKIFIEKWRGYGEQKNYAISKCTSTWVLLLDADEVVTPNLKNDIRMRVLANQDKVYKIKRRTFMFNRKTRQYDYAVRLFKKDSGRFDSKRVHESFITQYPIERINSYLEHYTYIDLTEYFRKFNNYTSLAAEDMFERGKKASLFKIVIAPQFKFFKKYFLKKWFLDGYIGFLSAFLSMVYNVVKYAKLKELYERQVNED